jgi:hypothetical protein
MYLLFVLRMQVLCPKLKLCSAMADIRMFQVDMIEDTGSI